MSLFEVARFVFAGILFSMGISCSFLCIPCYAQTPTLSASEKEQILIQRIETLEQRIKELEAMIRNQEENLKKLQHPSEEPQKDDQTKSATSEEPKPEDKKETKPSSSLPTLTPVWKDRLTFQSADKQFEVQVGGRIQADWAFFDNDEELSAVFGEEEDGAQFRRARIDLTGKIYESITYRLEFDFAGDKDSSGRGKFFDAYIGLTDLPYVGNLQIGHFREPFSLERLTNANFTTFMERSLSDVFAPKRNLGLMLLNSHFENRLIWQAGIFKETDDFPSDDDTDEDQGYSFTARLVGLPWYEENGRKMLHLGLAYSHRNPDGAPFRYRTHPECALAYSYLDTERYQGFRLADAVADTVDLYGSELLWIYGPFSIQSEYVLSEVDTYFDGTREFSGGYVYASYFLTGENRAYNPKTGVLTRVKPRNNFSPKKHTWGAWELALRYSWLDLDSGTIRGGKEYNWTLGLNWYLNPNTRIFINYTRADIQHDLYDGELNMLQTRFQIDF